MLSPGTCIGRYEVVGLVGVGGMAAVYRVRHAELGSVHALKLLSVHRERVRERLLSEGRAQAQVAHPNVVRVTDVLMHEDAPVLVMEYVDGPSLEDWLAHGRPPLEAAVDVVAGVARGLRAAHAAGLVHRDLKPANVLLASVGGGTPVPKIADFGLVKVLVEDAVGHGLTQAGVAMGTPEFMAPEQMRDASKVDPRADLYSLGCLLYTLVCGQIPFVGTNLVDLHARIRAGAYLRPDALVPGLPPALVDLVVALLCPEPGGRPQTCDEVLAVLESVEVRLPSGPGTSPSELHALAREHGAAWDRRYGLDPRVRVLRPSWRPAAVAALGVPVLAGLIAFVFPALPAERRLSLEEAGVGAPHAPAVVEPRSAPAPLPRAPEPLPVVRPAPVVARISLEGDALEAWLVRDGVRVALPGPVPPGTWDVTARFEGSDAVPAGRIEVGTAAATVRCSSFVMRCRF